jgi:hypothetical protein
VQPQVGIGGVGWRCVQIYVNQDDLSSDLANLVVDNCRNESWRSGAIVSWT